MFGECCFQTGDVKLTMGTGTFLDINTGNNPQQSVGGKELEFILFVNEISFFFTHLAIVILLSYFILRIFSNIFHYSSER